MHYLDKQPPEQVPLLSSPRGGGARVPGLEQNQRKYSSTQESVKSNGLSSTNSLPIRTKEPSTQTWMSWAKTVMGNRTKTPQEIENETQLKRLANYRYLFIRLIELIDINNSNETNQTQLKSIIALAIHDKFKINLTSQDSNNRYELNKLHVIHNEREIERIRGAIKLTPYTSENSENNKETYWLDFSISVNFREYPKQEGTIQIRLNKETYHKNRKLIESTQSLSKEKLANKKLLRSFMFMGTIPRKIKSEQFESIVDLSYKILIDKLTVRQTIIENSQTLLNSNNSTDTPPNQTS